MNFRNKTMIVSVVAALGLLVAGCSSKPASHKTTSKSTNTSTPLKNLDSVVGNHYMFTSEFYGKAAKDVKSIAWKKITPEYSLAFTSKTKAYVGHYQKKQLTGLKVYQVTTAKKGYFKFQQAAYITTEANYAHLSAEVKQTYVKVAANKVPGAAKGTTYYQSTKQNISKTPVYYRFYTDGKALIRQNAPKNNKYYYSKNTLSN